MPARRLATIGYEGHDVQSFIGLLEAQGIKRLVDVRELPLSRKRGFSKSALAAALASEGIEYRHAKALGAPREVRHALREDQDFSAFRRGYASHLARQREALEDLKAAARAAPTAIMCVEHDHAQCHRGIIGEALAREGFSVVHLAQ